jgi:hypothetical protein
MATGSAWKRERIAQGLCCACSNPLSPRSKWWCEEHIERRRKDSAERRAKNPKLLQQRSWISATRARIRVMVKLGGLFCAWCGERDYRVLSIDHINGRAANEKRSGGLSSKEIYAIDRNDEALSEYRVLCMNCQVIHEYQRGNRVIYPEVHAAILEVGDIIGRGENPHA